MSDQHAPELVDAIAAAKRGEESGLTTLFQAFHPRLLRYLRAREPRHADDIAGETWVAVAARVPGFEGDPGAFAGWLFTIAAHRLADLRRTGARRQTDPHPNPPDDRRGVSSEDVVLDELDAQGAVDLIVASLNADQSEVVLLRVLGGLSNPEIATALGRPEVWVRVTHHRAMRKLQAQLLERQR
ncbi:MAG: RNA polymerase sigma factor [Ilumatobacteraceae bacterium]